MVAHPVKGGGAEDHVRPIRQWNLRQPRLDKSHTWGEVSEMRDRLRKHLAGRIEGQNLAARQPLRKLPCQPASAASEVGDALVAAQRKPRKHCATPGDLRIRETMVLLGIPFVRHTEPD